MNKAELISEVTTRAGLDHHRAARAVSDMLMAIYEALSRGEKIVLADIGTLEVIKRPARKGRNPKTGESISIPAQNAIRFKAAKAIKETINR